MSTDIKLRVSEIQRFCMHDGYGIRTTVFLKGCPLRCAWCHNPETQKMQAELLFYEKKCIFCRACEACRQRVHSFSDVHGLARESCVSCGECTLTCPTRALEMCGEEKTVDEILQIVEKDRAFYGEKGGITLSGGEPFAQARGAIALLKACKERGLPTAVETCGHASGEDVLAAAEYTDLFLWDIKDTNDERLRLYTGVSGEKIKENLKAVDRAGAVTRLRCILVNGVNTDEDHYRELCRLASSLDYCEGIEFMPYHAYGGTKSVFLGRVDNGNVAWIPTEEQKRLAESIVRDSGIKVKTF